MSLLPIANIYRFGKGRDIMAKQEPGRIRQDSGHHRRILWVAALFGVLAFVPILCQLGKLMLGQFHYYANLALRNQTRTTPVQADRGIIYDCNMNILACSEAVENVYLDPHELKQSKADLPRVSAFLAQLLGLDADWVEEQGKDLTKRYKQIAARIDKETGAAIRAYINREGISGIHLEPATKRVYPYGSLAAQVIGFTNSGGDGCEGIESAYDAYLTGKNGKVITTKGNNEMDMPYSYEKYVEATPGCSVVLTIDATVQSILEKQMENAIARYDVQNGAFGIVMNVKTAEILAMATLGSYDPNAYQEIADEKTAAELKKLSDAYLSCPEGSEGYTAGKAAYQQALNAARLKQWRNRCISDGYEPGSTFKVITMASALDCGAIDLNTAFHCGGSEQIPGRSQLLHCWKSAGHGSEQTPQALQNSCNIAFAHIALKLGGERFYEYVTNFGIREKTGIDLSGESKGVFFDKALVTDTDKWGTASLTSGSFGQTFKLTPIQLVRGIAAVVNGGKLMEPYLVSEILDAEGNTILQQEPTVLRQVIREETSKTMCSLMESVVAEGTAKNAQVAGFSIGGKTGTSEKIDVFDENGNRVLDKIVSFVGVAPMDDPEVIVLIALDTPSRETGMYISGGVMAAPTVGAVMADILPYLEVEQNYAEEDIQGRQFLLEDYTGLSPKEAEKKLKDVYQTPSFQGDGDVVTGQLPAPGNTMPGGGEVILYLGQEPKLETIPAPSFLGLTREEAENLVKETGISLQITGNPDYDENVVVTAQFPEPGTSISIPGSVTIELTDIRAAD